MFFRRIVDSLFSFFLSPSLSEWWQWWCCWWLVFAVFYLGASLLSLSLSHSLSYMHTHTLTTFSCLFSVEGYDQLFRRFLSLHFGYRLMFLSNLGWKNNLYAYIVMMWCDVMYRIDIWFQKFHITLAHEIFNFQYSSLCRWKMNMKNSIFKCHSECASQTEIMLRLRMWLHILVTKRDKNEKDAMNRSRGMKRLVYRCGLIWFSCFLFKWIFYPFFIL